MRRVWTALAALLLATGVAVAYFVFTGTELTLTLTQAELETRLDAKFPLTKKHLGLFEVKYSNPRIVLMPDADRLRFAMDAELGNLIGQAGNRLSGTAEVTGGLRYDAERYEFYLTDPKVERIDIEGIPDSIASKVEPAFQTLAQEALERLPIYKLEPTDIKKVTARTVLKRIAVSNGNLVMVLGL